MCCCLFLLSWRVKQQAQRRDCLWACCLWDVGKGTDEQKTDQSFTSVVFKPVFRDPPPAIQCIWTISELPDSNRQLIIDWGNCETSDGPREEVWKPLSYISTTPPDGRVWRPTGLSGLHLSGGNRDWRPSVVFVCDCGTTGTGRMSWRGACQPYRRADGNWWSSSRDWWGYSR